MQSTNLAPTTGPGAALERRRRFVESSRPVVVDAKLRLGREMVLLQAPATSPADLPLPPHLQPVDTMRRSWPGNQTEFQLEETDRPIALEHAGCSTSIGIFGSPGTGKTHLMRKVLRELLAYAPECAERRFGGLILDPKGSIIDDICLVLDGHPRRDDLIIIDGSQYQAPVNVLSCSMPMGELAHLLVLAAQGAGVSASEPFWFIAWTNLFRAAMTLLEYYELNELTLSRLVKCIMNTDETGQREIQRIAVHVEQNARTRAQLCAQYFPGRSLDEIEGDLLDAANDIRSFYRAKDDYVATIETFIINAYGQFRSKRCGRFSPEPRSLARESESSRSLYDSILEDGKIVVVSLPPSEPRLAKTLCTLVKCLFQQTVMSRKRRFREMELNNWQRVVFLACDEYSEIASEVPGQPMGDGRFFGLARENGCFGLLATQSVHVLENSSLRDSWRAIFSNFAAKIFMGASDIETARQATELAGRIDWQVHTPTTSRSSDGFSFSVQQDLREREQIPTHVLTQMLCRGEAVVVGSLDGRAGRPQVRILRVEN